MPVNRHTDNWDWHLFWALLVFMILVGFWATMIFMFATDEYSGADIPGAPRFLDTINNHPIWRGN
jgi:hypothetical protein